MTARISRRTDLTHPNLDVSSVCLILATVSDSGLIRDLQGLLSLSLSSSVSSSGFSRADPEVDQYIFDVNARWN